jgi:hypothetical protein
VTDRHEKPEIIAMDKLPNYLGEIAWRSWKSRKANKRAGFKSRVYPGCEPKSSQYSQMSLTIRAALRLIMAMGDCAGSLVQLSCRPALGCPLHGPNSGIPSSSYGYHARDICRYKIELRWARTLPRASTVIKAGAAGCRESR